MRHSSRILVAVISALFFYSMKSQTAISLNNSNMPAANDTLRFTNVQLNSIGNYTQTGANFNWDFTNVISTTEGVRSFKSSLQTPYAFFFLGLNEYGEKIYDTLPVAQVPITKYYNFYKKQNSPQAFIADGVGLTFNNIPLPSYYTNKDELYLFPMTFPQHDSTTFRFASISTSLIPIGYSKTGYRVTHVDGWGTISTPNGTASCLRLITTQFSQDTMKLGPLPIGFPNVQRSYQWMTTSSKIPYFEVTGSLLGTAFTPSVVRYRGFKQEVVNTTGISTADLPGEMIIFPNPACDKLLIGGIKPGTILTISDSRGKLVWQGIAAVSDRIFELDVSGFSGGEYIFIASHGDEISTHRFVKE
jgi:hypothetical protein